MRMSWGWVTVCAVPRATSRMRADPRRATCAQWGLLATKRPHKHASFASRDSFNQEWPSNRVRSAMQVGTKVTPLRLLVWPVLQELLRSPVRPRVPRVSLLASAGIIRVCACRARPPLSSLSLGSPHASNALLVAHPTKWGRAVSAFSGTMQPRKWMGSFCAPLARRVRCAIPQAGLFPSSPLYAAFGGQAMKAPTSTAATPRVSASEMTNADPFDAGPCVHCAWRTIGRVVQEVSVRPAPPPRPPPGASLLPSA